MLYSTQKFLQHLVLSAFLLLGMSRAWSQNAETWVDPSTGHQVVHLTRLPGKDSSTLYFHQNSFTASGDKMIFLHSGSEKGTSLYTLDLSNSTDPGRGKSTHIANLPQGLIGAPVVAPRSRTVYYFNGQSIMATHVDTLKTRTIIDLPKDWDFSKQSLQGLTINSDETLLAGTETKGAAQVYGASGANGQSREDSVTSTWQARLPSFIFTVDIHTGKLSKILQGNDWYDHVQFSPTDPSLLMFAHEGPGDKVDRIWLIKSDGSSLKNVRPRRNPKEVVAHEFWDPTGKMIWFKFRDKDNGNRLVRRNIDDGQETVYVIPKDQVSMHYNISKDRKFLVGDGAHADPAIFIYTPKQDGTLKIEKLCDISRNNYKKREPSALISPDQQWAIFSTRETEFTQGFAVRLLKGD